MRHQTISTGIPILDDPFGIGQQAVARISAGVAREAMHRAASVAFNWRVDGGVLGRARQASMQTIHQQAAAERKALAVLRGAK